MFSTPCLESQITFCGRLKYTHNEMKICRLSLTINQPTTTTFYQIFNLHVNFLTLANILSLLALDVRRRLSSFSYHLMELLYH